MDHKLREAHSEQPESAGQSASEVPVQGSREFNRQVQALVGAEMQDAPNVAETRQKSEEDVKARLPKREAPQLSPELHRPAQAPQASTSEGVASIDVPKEIRKAGTFAVAGAGAGAAFAGGSNVLAGTALGASGLELAALAGTGAVSGATGFGLGALGLYGSGMLHNLVWAKKDKPQPGIIGTAARGVLSPVSVPFGLIYRAVTDK